MKNMLFLIGIFTFLLSTTQLSAQKYSEEGVEELTAPVFITLGLGVNHTGILSLGLQVPVDEKIAIFADAGLGGWGYKFGMGVGYFPKSALKGLGLNLAYYTAGGTANNNASVDIDTGNGPMPVVLNRTSTLNFTYSQNWQLGRKGRFSLIAGYAIPIGDKHSSYDTLGVELDDAGKLVMGILHPDGLIVGLKFLIGVGGR